MTTASNGLPWGKLILGIAGIWFGTKALTGKSPWELANEMARHQAEADRRREAEARRQQVLTDLGELSQPKPAASLPEDGTFRFLNFDLPVISAFPGPAVAPTPAPIPSASVVKPATYAPPPDHAWREKILHPSVALIMGKRGGGKSALGYRLLELFRFQAAPYVVGVPASARQLLPDWIGIVATLEEVPRKAIVLIDEAYLDYHARGSMAARSKAMSQLVNLSRQREQTLIFISQEARQIDRNIASSANVIIFKELGILQLAFDRPELNHIAEKARQAFVGVNSDKRSWSYLYAPDTDFQGLLQSELPTFWKPSLSRLFAAEAPPAPTRKAKQLSPTDKAARAKVMRAEGASYQQIADALGVTRGTALNYVKDYPYRSA